MDKPRDKAIARNRKIRRVIYLVLALGVVGAISFKLSQLQPAAQTVERSTVIIDTVRQGEMLRNFNIVHISKIIKPQGLPFKILQTCFGLLISFQ